MKRKGNAIRRKLDRGEVVTGVVSRLGSPVVVELIGLAGFDFVWIDMEHAGVTFETLENLCRAADAVDLEVVVRIPDKSPSNVLRALETGAGTVNVPFVETADEAAAIVDAAKFTPLGQRGFCTTSRGTGYGFGGAAGEVLAAANERTMVMVQIEGRRGVDNADAIAQVAGVDILFAGVADLSQSLSVAGQLGHPDVLEGAARIMGAAAAHGRSGAALLASAADAPAWLERGARMLALAVDVPLLAHALRTRRDEFHSMLKGAASAPTTREYPARN